MSQQQNNNQPSNTASANGAKNLQGNKTTIPPNAKVESVYQGQAISDTCKVEDNVPLVNDSNVKRERNWSMENEK